MVNKLPDISTNTKSLGLTPVTMNPKLNETITVNLTKIWTFCKRAIYKIGRSIYSIPVMKEMLDLQYEKRVAQYQAALPKLNTEDQTILEALQKTGTYSIPIADLQFASTESFLKKTRNLVDDLKNISGEEQTCIDLPQDKFVDCPEIFLWGIETRLLNVIEHYIGSPVYYQGYAMRRDIVTKANDSESIRAWHLDAEDRKVVKIIIYLNDVGVDGGRYEYIPRDLTKKAVKKINYYLGYLNDQTMTDIIPKQDWSNCMGKLGTVVISDVASVFHRANPPEKEDRYSISFCYTSDKPKYYWDTKRWPHNLSELRNQLNEKQRNALNRKNKILGLKL